MIFCVISQIWNSLFCGFISLNSSSWAENDKYLTINYIYSRSEVDRYVLQFLTVMHKQYIDK